MTFFRILTSGRKEWKNITETLPARRCIPKGRIRLPFLQENHECALAGHSSQGRDRTFWNLLRYSDVGPIEVLLAGHGKNCERACGGHVNPARDIHRGN